MQVLVALADAGGRTVGREELIARCWRGLSVGADAVDRAMGLLRRLCEQEPAAFQLETLPRIGYRLVAGDPIVHDLHARALLAMEQPSREPLEQSRAYLAEAVARAPAFAEAWAALAEAQRLLLLYRPPPEQAPAIAESRRSAERAVALDPRLGQAFGVLAMLTPRFNRWDEVEAQFARGLAAAPDHPSLSHQHALFLASVGRTRAGLEVLLRLQARNPLSTVLAVDAALALFDADRPEEALASIERARLLWPASLRVWSESVRLHAVTGDLARAGALLAAPPPSVAKGDVNLSRRKLHLRALTERRPDDMAAAVDNFQRFADIGVEPATVAIHALTSLGQTAEAIAVAETLFGPAAPQGLRTGVNMLSTFGATPPTSGSHRRSRRCLSASA